MNAKKESVGTVAALFDCAILAGPLDSAVLGITEKAALVNQRFERMEVDKSDAELALLKARELTDAQQEALHCFDEVQQQKEYLDVLSNNVIKDQSEYKKAVADRDLAAFKTLRNLQFQAIVDVSLARELFSRLSLPTVKKAFAESMKKDGVPLTAVEWSRLEQMSLFFNPSPTGFDSFEKYVKHVRSCSGSMQAIVRQDKKIVLDGASGCELYELFCKIRDAPYWKENFVVAAKVEKVPESVKEKKTEVAKKTPRSEKTRTEKTKPAPKAAPVEEVVEDEMKELSQMIQKFVVNEESPASGIQFGYSSDDSASSNKITTKIATPEKSNTISPAPPSDPEQKPSAEAIKSSEKPRRPRGSRGGNRREKRDSEGTKIEKQPKTTRPEKTPQETTDAVPVSEAKLKENKPVHEPKPKEDKTKVTTTEKGASTTERSTTERKERPQRDRPARTNGNVSQNGPRRPRNFDQQNPMIPHPGQFGPRNGFPPQPFHGGFHRGYGNGYAAPHFHQGFPMNNGYQNGYGNRYAEGRVRRPPPGVCGFTFVSA